VEGDTQLFGKIYPHKKHDSNDGWLERGY